MSKFSRFASFVGGLSAKSGADTDKDDKSAEKPVQREDESDEDFEKRLKKWEESGDDDEATKKGAETPKDTSDDDQDKVDGKKAQELADKARAEGHAAGVKAEKNRWTGVIAHKSAVGRPTAALNLLGDTDMTADAITKTLAALPVESARSTLANRQPHPTPAPSAEGGEDPTKAEGPTGFAARVQQAVGAVRPAPKSDKAA